MATSSLSSSSSANYYTPLATLVFRKTEDLSKDELEAVYRVWKIHVATQYSVTDFKNKVVDKYKYQLALLMYDNTKGTIRGCVFVSVYRNQMFQGERITIIQGGISYVEEDFRLAAAAVHRLARMDIMMKEFLINPLTPVYNIGEAVTYKGYMLGVRFKYNEDGYFPRYNKETPAFEKSLLDDYGRRMGGELYDPVTGVIRKEEVGLKDGVADDIEEKRLSNPHIQFFLNQNPDWKKGHMLCIVCKITWRNALKYLSARRRLFSNL